MLKIEFVVKKLLVVVVGMKLKCPDNCLTLESIYLGVVGGQREIEEGKHKAATCYLYQEKAKNFRRGALTIASSIGGGPGVGDAFIIDAAS